MSLQNVFEDFNSSLIPTELEKEKAATNKSYVLQRLASDFGTTELLSSGSYGHGTNVRGYSDIDYFAVTPGANLKKNSYTSLGDFKASLQKTFAQTTIGIRDPAVSVQFSTYGLSKHEIIPAFHVESKDGYRVFGISDRESGWMRSTPTGHGNWVTQQNTRLNGRLKKLIRILKAWNYFKSAGIRSFYLEMRATERMLKESIIFYSIDLLSVFRYFRAIELADMNDPIGTGSRIAACSIAQKATSLSRIETAIRIAEAARKFESDGRITEAYNQWNQLFDFKLPVMR